MIELRRRTTFGEYKLESLGSVIRFTPLEPSAEPVDFMPEEAIRLINDLKIMLMKFGYDTADNL